MTVFFAISRPVAMRRNVRDAGAASRDGRGLLWRSGRSTGKGVRSNAARLIFSQRPQSRLNCRIASQASSRRSSLRLGLWGDERGQEKSNLTEISHARGTPDKESDSNWQDSDRVQLRLPEGMRDKLVEAATANGRSLNDEIVRSAHAVAGARRNAKAIRPPQGTGRPPRDVRGRNSLHRRATQATRRVAPVRRPSRRRCYFSSDAGSLTFFSPDWRFSDGHDPAVLDLRQASPGIGATPGIDREPDCPTL